MTESITFEKLPEAVSFLIQEVRALKVILSKKKDEKPSTPQEKLLTIKEAAEFLNLSVATMYSKVSKGELPVMKRGKRLYFSSTELMDYLKGGRKLSHTQIEEKAQAYLNKNKICTSLV